MPPQLVPSVTQNLKYDIRIHSIFKKLLNRAHVTVTWTEQDGLLATNKRKTVLRQFEFRHQYYNWLNQQTAAGFTLTHETI